MKTISLPLLAASLLLGTAAAATTDGICSPAEAALGKCFETGPGYVVEAVCGPNGEFPVVDSAGDSVFAYRITGPGSNGNGCSGVHDVSHGDLMIPVCTASPLTVVSSSPTIELQSAGQGDPSCGFGSGDMTTQVVKWDVEVDCNESKVFSVTFAGAVDAGLTSFLLKDAGNCRTNDILGPKCPTPPEVFCEGTSGCPCGNDSMNGGGCANSTGVGAVLAVSGSTSVAADDFVLQASNLPPNQFGLFLMAQDLGPIDVDLGSGVLCLGGPGIKIVRIKPIVQSDAQGMAQTQPGLIALSCTGALADPAISCITPGSTYNFQFYYRDATPLAGCTEAANLTNALRVTFSN